MKVEELLADRFAGSPRYLTVERFSELAGLKGHQCLVEHWITEGALPTCWFGRYRLIDMQALLTAMSTNKGTQG